MNKFLDQDEKEEKKRSRLPELSLLVSVVVSVIVAGTTLLNNIQNVPLWWFYLSSIALVSLTILAPLMIFAHPISERFGEWKLRRNRNGIAHRHFTELKNLVEDFERASRSLFQVFDYLRNSLRGEVTQKIGELPIVLLKVHNQNDVTYPILTLRNRLEKSEVTFGEFTFLVDQLNIILGICETTLSMINNFREGIKRDARASIEYKIPEPVEREYEAFREIYNDFINYYNRFCRNLNQELKSHQESEVYAFRERFHLAKKW